MREAITNANGKTGERHGDSGCGNDNEDDDALSLFPRRRAMMILDRRIAILDLMAGRRRHTSEQKPLSRRRLPAFVSRQVVSARRWFLNLRPVGRTSRPPELAVVCGGCERVRGDYFLERHDFPYLCIEFVTAGRGTLTLEGRDHELVPGSVFSYGPGIPHAIRTDPRHRLRKYYVDFIGTAAATRMQAARIAPGSVLLVLQPQEIEEIFALLQQCGLAHSSHASALCGQLLGVLLTKIAERGLRADDVDPRAFDTYQRFRALLSAECRRLSSVAEAARLFQISSAYACRLFRRFDATSPYQHLLRERMNLAADLLSRRETGVERLLVKQVAAELGFADQYQFSRAFKRVFGISPARFQRETAG
jgi:AraC-like DNA-binding protein